MADHRKLLQDVGEALYGPRWQSELARALGLADRTMRRWIADPHEIPPGVWCDIEKLMLARSTEIEKLASTVRKLAAGA